MIILRWVITALFVSVAGICCLASMPDSLSTTRLTQSIGWQAREASSAFSNFVASLRGLGPELEARDYAAATSSPAANETFAVADALREQENAVISTLDGRMSIAETGLTIPYFQVEAYCSTHKECIVMEQQSYDALKLEWSGLSEDERHTVIQAANRSASMKYSVAESRARGFLQIHEFHRPAPKFRY